MKIGAGEDTDLQFDPRSSRNIVSTGNIHHTIVGEYKVKSLRRMEVNAVEGLFMSSPATTTIQGVSGMIVNGPGGMNLNSAKTTFETADLSITSAKTNFKTADFDIDSAKVDLTGSADVSISGKNVRVNSGAGGKIYLN